MPPYHRVTWDPKTCSNLLTVAGSWPLTGILSCCYVDTRLTNVKHIKHKLKKTLIKILFPIFLKKILILSDIYLGLHCIMDLQRKIYPHSNLSMHDTTSQIFKKWINIDWSTWSSKPHPSKLHKYCNQGGCEEQIKQWVEREMPGGLNPPLFCKAAPLTQQTKWMLWISFPFLRCWKL